MFTELAADSDPSKTLLLDTTHVKAHRSAAGVKGGRSWCRIATRNDKLAQHYLAVVALAAIVIYWL